MTARCRLDRIILCHDDVCAANFELRENIYRWKTIECTRCSSRVYLVQGEQKCYLAGIVCFVKMNGDRYFPSIN